MYFTTPVILAAAAFSSVVLAQNPFSFNTVPVVTAGAPFQITWSPSTGTVDTVTLQLKQGPASTLSTVLTIAPHVQNVGSYAWAVPATVTKGSNYTFAIIDDLNTAIINYSIQFAIDGPAAAATNAPVSTSISTAASGAATAAASSASGTTSATASTTAKSAADCAKVGLMGLVALGGAVAVLF